MPCSWSIMIKSELWTYPHASATCWVDLRPRKTWQAYLTFSGCFVTNPKSLGSRGWKPQKVTFFRLKKYSGAGAWKARSQSYQKLLKREKVLRLVCNLHYAFSASLWFWLQKVLLHTKLWEKLHFFWRACYNLHNIWKIIQKGSFFNIASEASYAYILSGQKFIKNAKNEEFLRVFNNQCYQTGQF